MAWPEISIDDFPHRRDDEPSSLRQDILDELSDHFVCALNRELLKNPDEQTAKQRVLNQFGDPIKIARQLWLEAMKEKIMSQRIMTGISAVMAVCCLAVVGIAWMLMKDSQGVNQKMLEQLAVIADRPQVDSTVVQSLQRSNEAIVSELKMLTERQNEGLSKGMGTFPSSMGFSETNQQILMKLDELNQKQAASGGSGSEGMNQISFQLVQDNKDQKPAAGFTGKLNKSGTQTDSFTVEAVSTADGKLEFGKLPWGKYYLNLKAPWGETFTQPELTVIPGRDYSETITCPAVAPADVPVQFQVNWSKRLKAEGWFLLCDFRQSDSSGGNVFRYSFGSIRRAGDVSWISDQNQFLKPRGVYLVDSDNRVSLCPISQDGKFEEINLESILEKPSVNMIQGAYCLPVMYLIQKADLKKLSSLNSPKTYNVINKNRIGVFSYDPKNGFQRADSLGFGFGFGGGLGGGFGGNDLSNIPTTVILAPFKNEPDSSDPVTLLDTFLQNKNVDGMPLPKVLNFTAGKDQTNLWKINLPDLEKVEFPENAKSR